MAPPALSLPPAHTHMRASQEPTPQFFLPTLTAAFLISTQLPVSQLGHGAAPHAQPREGRQQDEDAEEPRRQRPSHGDWGEQRPQSSSYAPSVSPAAQGNLCSVLTPPSGNPPWLPTPPRGQNLARVGTASPGYAQIPTAAQVTQGSGFPLVSHRPTNSLVSLEVPRPLAVPSRDTAQECQCGKPPGISCAGGSRTRQPFDGQEEPWLPSARSS